MLFRLAGDKVLAKPTLKRAWTQEEDAILIEAVKREGAHNWTVIARAFNGSRKDKQCRERWFNHLCPSVNKGSWTAEEDEIILKGVAEMGTSWSRIAQMLPGRTDHAIKNRYYSATRRHRAALDASRAAAGASGSTDWAAQGVHLGMPIQAVPMATPPVYAQQMPGVTMMAPVGVSPCMSVCGQAGGVLPQRQCCAQCGYAQVPAVGQPIGAPGQSCGQCGYVQVPTVGQPIGAGPWADGAGAGGASCEGALAPPYAQQLRPPQQQGQALARHAAPPYSQQPHPVLQHTLPIRPLQSGPSRWSYPEKPQQPHKPPQGNICFTQLTLAPQTQPQQPPQPQQQPPAEMYCTQTGGGGFYFASQQQQQSAQSQDAQQQQQQPFYEYGSAEQQQAQAQHQSACGVMMAAQQQQHQGGAPDPNSGHFAHYAQQQPGHGAAPQQPSSLVFADGTGNMSGQAACVQGQAGAQQMHAQNMQGRWAQVSMAQQMAADSAAAPAPILMQQPPPQAGYWVQAP